MYKLKIDVTGKDYLTKTYYGTLRFDTIEEARESATAVRNGLYDDYCNYQIKGYKVDIIPANDF